MKRFALVLLALALVGVSPMLAQANRGTITATVVGGDGAPLPGVTMDVSAPDTLTRRTVFTNEDGVAVATALDPSRSYTVTFSLEGFNTVEQSGVTVTAGQTSNLRAQLTMGVSETIQVTGEAPVVDVTNAITGQDITLELTESLPTARTYQSYLQLVPGVLPDSGEFSGNPASRSGVNYSDILGRIGQSSDNFYYIEGINVTDGVTGTFGANLNTEIIQEQSVLTGGLPAEYAGATGLISNVLTKSGGNQFSGSVNYYFQNDSLVADNKNREDETFDAYDAAVTLGGPIVKDKAWFYGSFRKVERDEDVIAPEGGFLRTVNIDNDQAFGKVTWSATPSTLLSATYLSDPQDRSGSTDETRSNARDFAREQGGDRYTGRVTQVWSNFLAEVGYSKHEADLNDLSVIQESANEIAVLAPDSITQLEEQRGGEGNNDLETRGSETINLAIEGSFDTSWGNHTLKVGYDTTEFNNYRDFNIVDDARYVSLDDRYLGQNITALEISGAISTLEFDATNPSDTSGLVTFGLNSNPAAFAAVDTNNDGVISNAEIQGIVFNSTAGNPHGQINYQRDFQSAAGAQETRSEGTTYYVQDTWQWNRWAVNAGVRVEKWEHFATSGENIYTFDDEVAPRVSVTYDLSGDGRQRLSAYYGRYYDPIRNNMTNFAGTLTGRVLEEQVFVAGQWLTYRIRGGPQVADALFAPTTQTPYTDEYQVGYKADLGQNMSIEANYIMRETRDILEDYDMGLYAVDSDGIPHYPGDVNAPNSLWLGPEYFGYTNGVPPSNFVIATLEGGERDWDGVELIFRKRYSNNWQLIASYSYNDAEGSSNSDSNADFQGDVLFLDPRAPNQFGTQPGLIENLFKVAGSYRWDNGFEVGGQFRFADGVKTSRTFRASNRNLPCRVAQASCGTENLPRFDFGGVLDSRWIAPGTVGTLDNPSYQILDLRVSYELAVGDWGNADFFLDIFNVADDQKATRNQDIVAGNDGVAFGEGLEFVQPRRYYLGARLRF